MRYGGVILPRLFLNCLILLLLAPLAWGMEAAEKLADPGLEARAIKLGEQLRCMVCQSESINDSPADLAKDLRLTVREKIREGMGDAAILDYLHTRYGDYVLLKPPVKGQTLPLWLAPWFFVGIGLTFFLLYLNRNKN